ncbi:MAG: cytochrome P450 [Pseudomonadales bacterium]|nr:cytochrome P450 [Pseudomonadales bacterium]
MNTSQQIPLYYDPYKPEIWQDPYRILKRLRKEAPLYYNEEYDFYAVSCYGDVAAGLMDAATFSSARGNIIELIKSDFQFPPGIIIMEDPPIHTAHRKVLSLLFTPKNIHHLEGKIRGICSQCMDTALEKGHFDFVTDLGAQMPMQVIGMLLGIPEQDLHHIQEITDATIRAESGKPINAETSICDAEDFEGYIEWRQKNPSDDIMTLLMNTEFKDDTGTQRKLTLEEITSMVMLMSAAGNETTSRLIGWAGKILAEHPDQRHQVADDRSLIPAMIEEVLRFEAPGAHAARYVTRDVIIRNQTIPKGSVVDFILASANRDDAIFENGDEFNIHRRNANAHLTFGKGIHTCIGLALARMEGRIAMEEVFKRVRDWEVDYDKAEFSPTTSVRGWDSLPAFLSTR